MRRSCRTWRQWWRSSRIVRHQVIDRRGSRWQLRNNLHGKINRRRPTTTNNRTRDRDRAQLRTGVGGYAIRCSAEDADERGVRRQHIIEFEIRRRSTAAVRCSQAIRQSFIGLRNTCLRSGFREQYFGDIDFGRINRRRNTMRARRRWRTGARW